MKTAKDMIASNIHFLNTVHPDDKVIKALQLMKCNNLNHVIVVAGGMFMGIMSETDYAKKVILEGKNSYETAVREIMDSECPVVDAADSMDTCFVIMNRLKANYLFVFDELNFIGVLTMQDMLREELAEKVK